MTKAKKAKKGDMAKKKERDISEMFDDPVAPDETDPDFMAEMFSLYQHRGEKPEDLEDPEEAEAYAAWLKDPENAENESSSEPKSERKDTSHIVDLTDEFLGKSIIITGVKKSK